MGHSMMQTWAFLLMFTGYYLLQSDALAIKFDCEFEIIHGQEPTLECVPKAKPSKAVCEIPEPPHNGGLVCLQVNSTVYCSRKCNPGFEFPGRIHSYYDCSHLTNMTWPEGMQEPCIPEFFPEFRIEGESGYFRQKCDELNEQSLQQEKESFIESLRQHRRNPNLCRGLCEKVVKCGQSSK